MTNTERKRIVDEAWAMYMARRAEIKAADAERRAALAKYYQRHTANTAPAIEVGALAPMSDYAESVRRGWSTD